MKRFILLLGSVGIISFSYGQNHQVSVGAGLLSSNAALNIVSSLGKNIVGGMFNGSTLTNSKQYGEFRVSYAYAPLNWLSTGATFSYSKATHDHFKNNTTIGYQTIDFYTVGAEATFYYMKKSNVSLYGLVGAGATLMKQEDKVANSNQKEQRDLQYFNFQISPIGIEVGAEHIGGFFELGFGYRGLASIGVFFRL